MPTNDSRKLVPTKEPGVYRRGGRYVVRWRYRGRSCKRSFPMFAEAREFKRTLHGAGKQPTTRQTVADYYDGWIDTYRGRTVRGLEDTTRTEYRRSFRLHVLPFPIARERVRDVTSRDVSDWFSDLEQAGVRGPSIRKAKAALGAMLATAAQAGDVQANPVIGVRYVPQTPQPRKKRKPLTVADVEAIMNAAPPGWQPFFQLLAESGCRVGELLGLTWADVHLGDDAHLYIGDQVYRGQRKRLKTEGSERAIPLSSGMARVLTDWKADSRYCADTDPVFPNEVGGALDYSNVYARVLKPTLKSCGLDGQGIGFHGFRKFAGSMLSARAGKTPVQVQRWLGHSQLTTTMNIYQHELDDGLGGAEALDDLWGHPGATRAPQTAADDGAELPAETGL